MRGGLHKKSITDKNGKRTTVWVGRGDNKGEGVRFGATMEEHKARHENSKRDLDKKRALTKEYDEKHNYASTTEGLTEQIVRARNAYNNSTDEKKRANAKSFLEGAKAHKAKQKNVDAQGDARVDRGSSKGSNQSGMMGALLKQYGNVIPENVKSALSLEGAKMYENGSGFTIYVGDEKKASFTMTDLNSWKK